MSEPYVQLHPSTVAACGGDANLGQIVAFFEFRAAWYESRTRGTPDPSLHRDGDGRVWVKASWAEVAEATGQTPASVRRRLDRLVEMEMVDRTAGVDNPFDRTYWYAANAASMRANRAEGVRANRAVVPIPQEGLEEGTTKNGDGSQIAHVGASLPERLAPFDEFWSVYPRRTGKAAAEKAFFAACKKATGGTIIAAAARFRDDPNRVDQFTPHPATWLNQGRWDDDPLPRRATGGPPQRESAVEKMTRLGIMRNGR